jgi:hypothetical protein
MQQPEMQPQPLNLPPHEALVWDVTRGLGFCAARAEPNFYGREYWNEYVTRSATPLGAALTKVRCDLVARHIDNQELVDIGIGSGQFVQVRNALHRRRTFGHDVNPWAFEWLKARGLWRSEADMLRKGVANLSYWDTLEHIDVPSRLFGACTGHVFVSMPIYESRSAVVASKHFKPGEHLWYFTWRGLMRWAYELGFVLVEENTMETDLGREGIATFVFRRER